MPDPRSSQMRYLFLTAFRNESPILRTFLDEFTAMVRQAGIADDAVLYMVDDLSTDRSGEILDAYRARPDAVPLHVIRTPTNMGNQGALFYGIARVDVARDDVLVTFDCDGEDDVRQIPSVLEAGKQDPDRLVLIERGRRRESLRFKLFFRAYKTLFRFLTGRPRNPLDRDRVDDRGVRRICATRRFGPRHRLQAQRLLPHRARRRATRSTETPIGSRQRGTTCRSRRKIWYRIQLIGAGGTPRCVTGGRRRLRSQRIAVRTARMGRNRPLLKQDRKSVV